MKKLLCLLMLTGACAVAQTVEGSVFDAATGVAISGVKVELLRDTTPFHETTTDGGGRFRFDNIREADYSIRYQSPDYWLTAGPTDYKPFHVSADSPVKLEARLMPWSKISGRVVDGRGSGVAKAMLQLTGSGMVANGRTYLRTSWGGGGGGQLSDGKHSMTFRGETDAQGRFEVRLMPGSYRLSADPPPELKAPAQDPDGPVLVWTRTWYPSVGSLEAASNIVALPGGGAMDVELKLRAVPGRAIRGVLLNPDGSPAPKVKVATVQQFLGAFVESKSDGTFEFPAVAEGEWRLLAEVEKGSVRLRATEWIEVKRFDLENVKLRMVAPLALHGKVVTEAPKDAPPLRPIPLLLTPAGGRSGQESDLLLAGSAPALPDLRGEFVLEVYPGTYRVGPTLQPPPAPYYLDSVRIGGADLTRQEVEIASGGEITVLYKADVGSVSGTAENCASGGVMLVPADPALRGRGVSRAGPCESSGRYEVRGVRPGEYYAVAFAGNGPVVAVDEALLKGAARVTVRVGEMSTVDVRAVTRPVY